MWTIATGKSPAPDLSGMSTRTSRHDVWPAAYPHRCMHTHNHSLEAALPAISHCMRIRFRAELDQVFRSFSRASPTFYRFVTDVLQADL